jgi:hypothetical protein
MIIEFVQVSRSQKAERQQHMTRVVSLHASLIFPQKWLTVLNKKLQEKNKSK